MIDIVVAQRVKPGKDEAFEAIAKKVGASTLANDEGCLRSKGSRGKIVLFYVCSCNRSSGSLPIRGDLRSD